MSLGGIYLEELKHGGAYFRNFTVLQNDITQHNVSQHNTAQHYTAQYKSNATHDMYNTVQSSTT